MIIGGISMRIKAYAKINISLDVVGKRQDGYHLLKMIMQSVDLYDVIYINKLEKGIELTCNKNYIPVNNKNIAYRAAELFLNTYGINSGVKIDIKKNIPTAAGLGGGSSDGAAVLRAMKALFNIKASSEELEKMALKIGADVPFLIKGGTALCEGIGEIIKPTKSFKNKIVVLVKPEFGISTKEVYNEYDKIEKVLHPDTESILKAVEKDDLKFICKNMINVLENVSIIKHPVIDTVKKDMKKYGALGTMMSGSGPSVFAFFDDSLKAQICFENMKKKYKQVFITRTI